MVCYNNPLKFNFTLTQWELFNVLRKYYLGKKYIFLWRRYIRSYYANIFKPLNLEVLYSPNNFTKPYLLRRKFHWND